MGNIAHKKFFGLARGLSHSQLVLVHGCCLPTGLGLVPDHLRHVDAAAEAIRGRVEVTGGVFGPREIAEGPSGRAFEASGRCRERKVKVEGANGRVGAGRGIRQVIAQHPSSIATRMTDGRNPERPLAHADSMFGPADEDELEAVLALNHAPPGSGE